MVFMYMRRMQPALSVAARSSANRSALALHQLLIALRPSVLIHLLVLATARLV